MKKITEAVKNMGKFGVYQEAAAGTCWECPVRVIPFSKYKNQNAE